MSVDLKLYRIFQAAAGRAGYPSRRALAMHVADLETDEFSYIRRGRKEHANWGAIASYVSLLVALEMLDENLNPFVAAKVTLAGFGKSLADKAIQFAKKNKFGLDSIDEAIRHHIGQRPAILPTPFAIFEHLGPTCSYRSFYRIIRLKCLEDDRIGLRIRTRPIVATKKTIELGGAD
jgi:hypothetical protein